jgi:hypothetical protein
MESKRQKHRESNNKYARRIRAECKKQGLCVHCKYPIGSPEHKQCVEKRRIEDKIRRYEYYEKNECPVCHFPTTSSEHEQCVTKINKFTNEKNQIRQERKEQGLCSECGYPHNSNEHKEKCLIPRKNLRLFNISNGFCGKHPKNKLIPNLRRCEECFFRKVARRATGNEKDWKLLRGLLHQQNFKCAYSGKLLTIGDNASIDHKIPKSRNGASSLENVHWIDITINKKYKNWMSHDNFLDLCRGTYDRYKSGKMLDVHDQILVQVWNYQISIANIAA